MTYKLSLASSVVATVIKNQQTISSYRELAIWLGVEKDIPFQLRTLSKELIRETYFFIEGNSPADRIGYRLEDAIYIYETYCTIDMQEELLNYFRKENNVTRISSN